MQQKPRPRVDFYKLEGDNRTRINRFCCQLADKVVKMGNAVFVKTRDAAETRLMDDLMWTYSDSSFLPHAVLGEDSDDTAPVKIGHQNSDAEAFLLINLGDEMPANVQRYERIAEIINAAPQTLQQGRQRYSTYKQKDFPLHFHEITS